MKLTRDEHMRAEGALNALDVAGPRILELEAERDMLRLDLYDRSELVTAQNFAEMQQRAEKAEAQVARLSEPVSDEEANNWSLSVWVQHKCSQVIAPRKVQPVL